MMDKVALWMSEPSVSFGEIAYRQGFRTLILDVEHGTFDLDSLDRFLGFSKARGFRTLVKVLSPEVAPVQQALDFGADGVIIPHLMDIDHARAICAAAKYPGLGSRSYTSARASGYSRLTQDDLGRRNRETRCYAMIETAESLADVEKIAALPTVDGLFPGPTDLSLSCGRGQYAFGPDHQKDLERCAAAAEAAGKSWIMPGWSPAERKFAHDFGAEMLVSANQYGSINLGLTTTVSMLEAEFAAF